MNNLYDQMSKRNTPSIKKVASSPLSQEKVAGIAEELAMIAANMEKEQLATQPAEELPVELQEELAAAEAEAAVAEEAPVEEVPAEEAPAEEESEEPAEEESEESEEEAEEPAEEEEEKEATAMEFLDNLLKLAAEEVAQAIAQEQMAPPTPELENSVQLLSILEEAAVKEQQDSQIEAQEKAIQEAINEKALGLAQEILTSDETQGQIMAEAEKMAYSLVPSILKIAGISMREYAIGLIGDEKLAGVILDEAEKIASETGVPVALAMEDIVKVAMSQE